MQLRRLGRTAAGVGTACILATSVIALAGTGSAEAAVVTHKVPGIESAIACLGSKFCAAVGETGSGEGTVDALTNGASSHYAKIRGTREFYSVSCPDSKGCWALGSSGNDVNAYLEKLGSTGHPVKGYSKAVPSGVDLTSISCVSMTSCEVAGTDVFKTPAAIEYGSWNGRSLKLKQVKGVKGTSGFDIGGLSCWHSDCVAVASGFGPSAGKVESVTMTIRNGKAGSLHRVSGVTLNDVACVTSSRCYTDGYGTAGVAGVAYTLTKGVASDRQTTSGDLFGIECSGSDCTAAGLTDGTGSQIYQGFVVIMTRGALSSSPVLIPAIGGLNDVARSGGHYAAVGTQPSDSGTEIAVG